MCVCGVCACVWSVGKGPNCLFCHQKFHSFLMSCISSLVLTNFNQAACGRTVKALAWVSEDRRFETTWVHFFFFFFFSCECVWCGVGSYWISSLFFFFFFIIIIIDVYQLTTVKLLMSIN